LLIFTSLLTIQNLFGQNERIGCPNFTIEDKSVSSSIEEIFVDQKTNTPYFVSKQSIRAGENEHFTLPHDFGEILEIKDNYAYTRIYKPYSADPDAYKMGAKVIVKQYKFDDHQIILTDSAIHHASEGGPGPLWYWNKIGVRIPAEYTPTYSWYQNKSLFINKTEGKVEYKILQDKDTIHSGFLKGTDFHNRYIKETKLIADGMIVYSRNSDINNGYLTLFSLKGDLKWEKTTQPLKEKTSDWSGGIFTQNATNNIFISSYKFSQGLTYCTISLLNSNTGEIIWEHTKKAKDLRILQSIIDDNHVGFITGKIVVKSSNAYYYSDCNVEGLDSSGNSICSTKVEGTFKQVVATVSDVGLKIITIPYLTSNEH
jgi:hypothetical protein